MTVKEWLKHSTAVLSSNNIGTAELDSLILLEDILGKDRSWLLAHPEHILNSENIRTLDTHIAQRAKHIPLAYVRKRTEFFGRGFYVDERVLEPRPESETMIELLLTLPLNKVVCIADIGTGSGALGISAKLERPEWDVDILDIDPSALIVARKNVQRHGVKINIIRSDLLKESIRSYDVLLANLPYVPDSYTINDAAMYEPKHAIFGGQDGLDIYRHLFEQVAVRTNKKPNYILTESLPPQHTTLAQIARECGYLQHIEQDFIQVFTNR